MGSTTSQLRRARAKQMAESPLRLAAIDIGSNSIHMIAADADADGGITPIFRLKEMVGLGRATFPSRSFSRETIDQAVGAMAKFHKAAIHHGCEKVIAVATSAVREATNGGDLLQRVRRHFGLDVRIISGREEARLIYLGVRHATAMKGQKHLIVDIGGGSVEFIVADQRRALLLESRKLGAARMTAAHVKSDPITDAEQKALLQQYERELTPIVEQIETLKPARVIGTSGTLENIAVMLALHEATPRPSTNGSPRPMFIERPALNALVEELIASDSSEREGMVGLDPGRKDQIVAGALLVSEIFRRLHIRRMQISKAALREGILVDYLERHRPDLAIRQQIPQPRLRSVVALARRCSWHKSHSEQVARLCVRLFDQLQSLHGMNARQRELIEYGALLHDIGWHIGRDKHHKHSMYLIENGDLKNFTHEETGIIANIARYHRKTEPKLKHGAYAKLSPGGRKVVNVGAALLRVADGLDRSHSNVVRDLKCRSSDEQVRCIVTARWDAQLECWGAARKAKLFQKVFRRPITFEVVRE